MNKDSRLYSIPVKTAAIIASALLFAVGVSCLEIFVWLLEEGIYDMNLSEISSYLSKWAERFGNGDYLTFVTFLIQARYMVVLVGFVTAILYLVLMTFVFTITGHKRGVEGIRRNLVDELPFDVTIVIYVLIFSIAVSFVSEADSYSMIVGAISALTGYCIAYFITLGFAMNFVVNVKTRTLFSNMLVMRAGRAIGKMISEITKIPNAFVKGLVYFGGVLLLEFGMIIVIGRHNPDAIWILSHLLFLAGLFYLIVSMKKIELAGKKIASGDTEYRINTKGMIGDFKVMAEQLNTIGEGLENAVNERMKSERFKTELITNVSHDIKTPLTSIINYTGLLKKENLDEEPIKGYIEVLDRQSARLKRLIIDLIDASKASSGSLQVDLTEFDIGVMLGQTIGEYQDKLEKAGLSVVTKFPEENFYIKADGRHLWRVIDNILHNIFKYAKRDTRVYIDLEKTEEGVVAVFKNISAAELNISGEELMERFVRGERARNTEGSGLGLSIAKSLMELMGGRLKVVVDGDLFKILLIFPYL